MSTATILVVEDNPITRKMLRVTLETEHFAVLEAADGATALDLLEREHPALVLQDFVLPDITGTELLRRIRRARDAHSLPVVLLTGLASRTAEFEKGGEFTAILPKPIEPSRLVNMVRTLLESPERPRQTAPHPPRRVLVVDDEPANRKLAEIQLGLAGYRPAAVASVEDALRDARRQPPDVILGDVLMPGLDGFQLCLAVRRDPALAKVPIVLVSSAYTDDADRDLARQVGAADLVVRTAGFEDAIAAIEAACAPGAQPPSGAAPPSDQAYLESLRRQIDRQLIHNQVLARRAGIQAAALSMVGALAQALANPRELTHVLGDVLVHCLDAAGLSTGILYLRAPDGTLRVNALAGLPEPLRHAAEEAFGHGHALRPRGDLVAAFNERSSDPEERGFLSGLKRRSALVVPFVVLGQHHGTLVLASDEHDLADETWMSFARVLASQFGQAVALARSLEELAESDALLRSAVEASPNGMIMSNGDGRIVMVNRQAEQLFGYAAGELMGRSLENLLPARYRAAHVGHRAAFMAQPQPRTMGTGRELFGLHKSGREIPVEIGLAPVQRGDQHFVIASVVDITERKRTEERVRWLSLAIEQGPTSVVMADLKGDIEYVNSRFTDVTGYTLEDVRGKNPRLLKSGHTPPEVYRELWGAITTGHPWHGELLNRRKDGTTYWDAMWVYPVKDATGTVTRYLALKEDISERKRAQEALAQTAGRVQLLMETANDGVSVLSSAGDIREVNRRMCEIAGQAASELIGRNVADLVAPAAAAQLSAFQDAVASGTGTVLGVEIKRPDGTSVIVDFSLSVVDVGGEKVALALARDVTEQRSLEVQLRQAQKMEAIGRLAGGVAHDFNNVLTAVFGYLDFLHEDLPAESPAQQDVIQIRKAAERAAGLTRQLLAFSRQQVLAPIVLNPKELLEDFEKMLGRLIGEDVALRYTLQDDVGNVRADPSQLHQVIMNLVVNARDAMPTGGTLIIEARNADLTEEYADLHQPVVPGPYVMLAVSDTGMGMTPEVQARVFEPFFTTKERHKGTGLGLSTVYGIVKQSGGYVWVYSEVGRGTTFKIYLPRVDAPVEQVTAPREAGSLAGNETILVAEDDAILRPLATALLGKLGYKVLEAEDAPTALAAARAHHGPIQLLVADVVMPGASGRELARQLAKLRPDTRVLYVSGYTDDAIVQHGLLEPGLNYLQKPFTPAALARRVREVLDAT